jgi:hypothetical protein
MILHDVLNVSYHQAYERTSALSIAQCISLPVVPSYLRPKEDKPFEHLIRLAYIRRFEYSGFTIDGAMRFVLISVMYLIRLDHGAPHSVHAVV